MTARTTLLVDLDGTLTDNYPGIARSIAYALERMGAPVPDAATLRRCVGPPLRASFARLIEGADAATVEQAIAFYRERYGEVGWRENVVYPGVPESLEALAAGGTALHLCTSKPEVFARRIVTLFGLSQHFTGIYGADLAGRLDDKAALFAHAVRDAGMDAERAVMIGDREHDVRAARANGARAVGVLWGYGSREELGHADALAAAPGELPSAVAAATTPPRR